MSTLPCAASKGEKGKSKYQSLDINNLYKVYTTEPSETQQPKNTLPRKHGMQSLGKVPTARRPPANLPSLKSEHTGSDTAVSLVPSGGAGWGKQEPHSPSSTTPPPLTSVPNSNTISPSSTNTQLNTHPATSVPVPSIPPPIKHHHLPSATPVTADKSWSSIMSGADIFQPPPYQSPQFQHEFPSLSADGAPPRAGADTQYGPGPSLRPQTEGSWIQGGARPGTETIPKVNSDQLAHQPQHSVQVGHINQQQQLLPPQFRGVMPPFMCRGNFAPNGPMGPNFISGPGSGSVNGRNPPPENRTVQRHAENVEGLHRPIIKEEDLSRMDDMSKDIGWASHDDIDYNQKLTFSDDEGETTKSSKKSLIHKEHEKTDLNSFEGTNKSNWSGVKSVPNTQSAGLEGGKHHPNEEDDVWVQRRRQQSEKVAIVVERAKQRKEEEEKRFIETRQAAEKKLKMLEEKMSKTKLDKEVDESQGTINPSIVPQQPINPVPIPVPNWEKEKDIRPHLTGVEASTNQAQYREASDFRKLSQIEARNFVRKDIRSSTRDSRDREQNGPSFSKQFQSDLPPRFLKQLHVPTSQSHASSNNNHPAVNEQYDNTNWQPNQGTNKTNVSSSHKVTPVIEDRIQQENESKDNCLITDDNYKTLHNHYADINKIEKKIEERREYQNEDYVSRRDNKKDEKWVKDTRISEKKTAPQYTFEDHRGVSGSERDRRYYRERDKVDDKFQDRYDDRRKEHYKEERRSVPGPITRERVEADDLKSEKKNLTQLKRGCIPEKRTTDIKKHIEVIDKVSDDGWTIPKNRDKVNNEIKGSSDMQPLKITTTDKYVDIVDKSKSIAMVKMEEKSEDIDLKKDDKERVSRRYPDSRHSDSRQMPWGTGGYLYPRSWSKKNELSRRGGRNGGLRKSSSKGGESHGTDSDVSIEDVSTFNSKKPEKDERNKDIKTEKLFSNSDRKSDINKRDNYLPRGEPSRHGRGGSSFRNRGGLGKRIDGYGPPSKSPFGQLEDKKFGSEDSTPVTSSDEKTKQNQQALSAGIIGSNRNGTNQDFDSTEFTDDKCDDSKGLAVNQISKKENFQVDNVDTSENSDECGGVKEQMSVSNKFGSVKNPSDRSNSAMRRNNPPPRFNNEKRNYNSGMRQNSSGSLKVGSAKVLEDPVKLKSKTSEELKSVDGGEKVCDSDGFQEVKSKKVGPRQKANDDKVVFKPISKVDKPLERKKSNRPGPALTPEQIASIPSLMDTPINPPPNRNQYDRMRPKLPPRFAKQQENNRLQKVQQGMCDLNDMSKMHHNLNVYNVKDTQNGITGRIGNAWEKPLATHVRTDQDVMLSVAMDSAKTTEQVQQPAPNIEKVIMSNHVAEKTVLDGATPPVNTIIFENTNFKTAPGTRSSRPEKSGINESVIDQTVLSSFNKPAMRDLLNKNEKQAEPIDMNDMKLDFFETEISHLTDDKGPKNLPLSRSMHTITSTNNTLLACSTDSLNFKIASVKRVWENVPSGMEHSAGQEDSNSSFSNSFGTDPNTLDSSTAFAKSSEVVDEPHEVYPPSPNQNISSSTTNICKVKPTQQVSTGSQSVHIAGTHPQHSTVVGPGIVGHPLSPPPIPPVLGGAVGIGQPPQQFTSNQHIGYQPNLGANSQYGISAVPSPPTVLFNSSPQLQAAQTGLYGAFQLDQAQVLSSQGRTQFSQYPYGLGQTASSPYSAQSMYLQGAQPHPNTAQPPPDIYQNLNSYRLSTTGHFGQGQQLTNPSTVLISSTSNSLMSATVKPTTQQISAIGTKANGAGQAYQQQSQQGQQLYMTYDPSMQANYLPSTGVMQRSNAPLQNNVVPGLQPSSSYYTGSTGGQTSFFQQPTNSTLQSQLSHSGYGLQGNVFGNHNQSHANAGLQNFGGPYLSNPMQLAAAALSAQYRSTNLQNSPYVKSVNLAEQGTRSQQIKSPNNHQDMLSSVFNTGPQIPSPKSRQNMKPMQQPNPSAQMKFSLYQAVGNQPQQAPRFPAPIQRPINFQATLGAMHGNMVSSNNPKHRSAGQNNKLGGRNYYSQGNSLSSSQNDKGDHGKHTDAVTSNSSNSPLGSNTTSIVTKAIITTNSTITVNQTTEIKETSTKDETNVIKD